MEILESYRGFDIVETDWTRAGGSSRILIIPGLKDRLGSPTLTRRSDAREYIDAELAGRENTADMMREEFVVQVKPKGGSLGVTIPASAARVLCLQAGENVRVTIERV